MAVGKYASLLKNVAMRGVRPSDDWEEIEVRRVNY